MQAKEILLWKRLSCADEEAFSIIYKEQIKNLLQYGLKFTQNMPLIEDCIQDVFSNVLDSKRQLSLPQNVGYYLMGALRNRLIRQLRTEKKLEITSDEVQFEFYLARIDKTSLKEKEEYFEYEKLNQSINDLPPRQKEVIYLRFSREYSYEVIAEIMDIRIDACRNLVYRALTTLRKELSREQFCCF
ncbi:sigma-70 family RNA polymerase sigma factor [uncultured Draconibacterium sp.]|uniref:RNA polymerase sigma factor n=1 Tax=uncultured Draconibacterium sp. TaxID=1573823 RepID=UPI0029C8E9A7|nr:sigma-70 family RNA polymerase sigma factor [uncultured Draconibacterium sp.]